ncbi:MAG: GTP-binding protein [Promethearchaeota archaeon]
MTGPLQCGKSSYVKYLDKKALNVKAKGQDNIYYTVGMDMGTLKLNGFDIFLFGTPGLLRFSVMRDVVSEGADGVVFIFDSACPEKDNDAITILNSIRKLIEPNTPIVFLANKQDIEGARPVQVIQSQNKLSEKYKIFPTSTKDGTNVLESIKYLVNEIYEKYKELIETLREYETNIRGLAEKLKMNKSQIRDFLNNLEIKRFIEIDRIKRIYKVKKGLKNLI